MSLFIYGIIIILFLVFILWTWNNTKCFENTYKRISYIVIGTLIITIVTLIIFSISKISINFPHQEMIGKIRNMILLIFIPINGFIVLPQIANTIEKVKKDSITNEQLKKRLIIYIIFIIIITMFECSYFKNIQNEVIRLINLK